MKPKPTFEELVKELIDAYVLIDEAVPLALRLLRTGRASLIEQQFFWRAVQSVEHNGTMDLLDLDDENQPLDTGPTNLYARLDELRNLLVPEEGA